MDGSMAGISIGYGSADGGISRWLWMGRQWDFLLGTGWPTVGFPIGYGSPYSGICHFVLMAILLNLLRKHSAAGRNFGRLLHFWVHNLAEFITAALGSRTELRQSATCFECTILLDLLPSFSSEFKSASVSQMVLGDTTVGRKTEVRRKVEVRRKTEVGRKAEVYRQAAVCRQAAVHWQAAVHRQVAVHWQEASFTAPMGISTVSPSHCRATHTQWEIPLSANPYPTENPTVGRPVPNGNSFHRPIRSQWEIPLSANP
ncbi:hypothetical protein B0H21DRAFT_714407 [Amylocystis lapponica]|nr:hypothetical protein B0H21DRAFT_714407 [Amylocystis lapponica]